ncbi:hypothetical protein pdam_00003524, partial [Pocillopora damicornis]
MVDSKENYKSDLGVRGLKEDKRKLRRHVHSLGFNLNPFTPTSDQDRISPYNIKQAGDENREEYQSWDY